MRKEFVSLEDCGHKIEGSANQDSANMSLDRYAILAKLVPIYETFGCMNCRYDVLEDAKKFFCLFRFMIVKKKALFG